MGVLVARRRGPVRSLVRGEREAEALELASQGLSVREIAARTGVSFSTAAARVRGAIAKLPDADADLHRRQMVAEIERVKRAAWELVEHPPRVVSAGKILDAADANAVNGALGSILKALERQARLLGLDAPSRQTVQVIDNRALEEAIAELEAQLDRTVEGSVGGEGAGDGGSGAVGEVCASEAGVGEASG